jgi:hypothetical protein
LGPGVFVRLGTTKEEGKNELIRERPYVEKKEFVVVAVLIKSYCSYYHRVSFVVVLAFLILAFVMLAVLFPVLGMHYFRLIQ